MHRTSCEHSWLTCYPTCSADNAGSSHEPSQHIFQAHQETRLYIAVTQDLSPHARLSQLVSGSLLSQAVYAAANLRLADHLLGGPQTATHLARATGAPAGGLYRLLR